ncbi:sigma-G-dependent sporulation-specific acid-soluble spore protein CsgA [Aquibacillus koreensis]|uniref:Sigma-G-dependent sporulation-specific acid-soluble spore protein CsgA n=1 Tax=Aquibacillus koreensis TaxID=279446 RepID=A0A9X3WNB0_9BACI|nr:sigma-G-dependent sporulation-specific acid-soluble spore protein CsgA [Aquibacillus koreensis]MCT2536323.1 sigma-G-dependent sporulation-specific acid-soluble spore protein CsgA [Aquibacillus koreensis]MDC3421326.1 sigma-G-dependent sporulation-specific acid-soluble spore protein CsgA [Aquibacillus koreensis]
MDQNLAYLREVLSNYTEENEAISHIVEQLVHSNYASEKDFVDALEQEDVEMLSQLLNKEMHYANESGDHERGYQLNEIYEILY